MTIKGKNALCLGLILAAMIFTVHSKAEIDPGTIVGSWFFDDGKGNEVEDSSGNGYHGDMEGDFKWIDGQFGTALAPSSRH